MISNSDKVLYAKILSVSLYRTVKYWKKTKCSQQQIFKNNICHKRDNNMGKLYIHKIVLES